MKKTHFLTALLTLCLACLALAFGAFADDPETVWGDADGDGVVNVEDVIVMRKYFANFDYDTGISCVEIGAAADINIDCEINLQDLYFLRKYLVDGELPKPKYSVGLEFTSKGDGTCSVSGIGACTDTNVVIPPISPNGDCVTAVAQNAFKSCSRLVSITIPNSVTNIASSAFLYCKNLESVTIPDSVAFIGNNAFEGCSKIKSIVVPDSVTTIGLSAFYQCTSLNSITIPFTGYNKNGTSNTNFGYIFGAKNTGTHSSYIPSSLKSVIITGGCISNSAFVDCNNLTSVTIGDNVTSIGAGAFSYCSNLIDVTIGSGVTNVGSNAFYACQKLKKVFINDIAAWVNISFSEEDSNPLYYGANLYLNGELVSELTIPNGVTSISNYAFRRCTSLTKVIMPDSVTDIGEWSFAGCENLESVTIGDGVMNIGYCAFYVCSNLKNVIFSADSQCENIDYDAFKGCTNLNEVYIGNLDTWCSISFADSDSNPLNNGASLYINGEVAIKLTIPNSVTSISAYAFYNCKDLTSIVIPDSVSSIGLYAFYMCSNLKTVYYTGDIDQWNKISIGNSNPKLIDATKIYNYQPE